MKPVRLSVLRSELLPRYGPHTDAAISLLGNDLHPEMLQWAKEGFLLSAHALQRIHPAQRDSFTSDHWAPIRRHGWPVRGMRPDWLAKPLESRREAAPGIQVDFRPTFVNPRRFRDSGEFHAVHVRTGQSVGFVDYVQREAPRVLEHDDAWLIQNIQQTTEGLRHLELHRTRSSGFSHRDYRSIKGWDSALLRALEAEARRQGIRSIFVNVGAEAEAKAKTDKPLMSDLMHHYGRLLLREGYRLEEFERPRPLASSREPPRYDLYWVKHLN